MALFDRDCSEACFSAKNAPAKQPELCSVYGANKMILADGNIERMGQAIAALRPALGSKSKSE